MLGRKGEALLVQARPSRRNVEHRPHLLGENSVTAHPFAPFARIKLSAAERPHPVEKHVQVKAGEVLAGEKFPVVYERVLQLA